MGLAVLDAAAVLLEELTSFEARELSGPDCARVVTELARVRNSCGAAIATAGRRAVDSGVAQSAGFKDGASWMASQSGSTPGQARQELEAVKHLDQMPETKAAFVAGEISPSQMVEIAQSEAETPGVERTLLGVAREGDLSKLREKAREERQARTPVEDLHETQQKARYFRHWKDRLGMVCGQFALPPEVGVPFINRIEAGTPRARTKHRQTRPDGAPDHKWQAYAADALVEMFSESGRPKRTPRAEVIFVVSLDAYRRGHVHADEGEVCHILGGGPIPVQVIREMERDAAVKLVLYDGVEIQKVKHLGRYRPAELETALLLGPAPAFPGRRCDHPGCGSRFGLQFDHIDPVANDGPTTYDNLQALCWHHHQEKTDRDRRAGLLGPHARRRKQEPRAGPFDDP
ncbi:MAG TPA: DUF222 domain-containing protein [Acidimicrobiales bacterium]|nr:DUF222 domain-containing protein [Acidimicrobiales bacterium]